MKRSYQFLAAFTFVFTLSVSMSAVCAADASPTAFLKNQNARLDPLLKKSDANSAKILKIVSNLLDFDSLCKKSLGKHWEGRTEAQRKEFSSTLRALIEKNLVKRLSETRENRITYTSEKVEGKKATVVTMVSTGDGPRAEKTEIEYKMRKKGKGWIAVDMITDGISLVNNYRSQFNKIITKDGWDTLMKKMKDKLAE